MSLFSKDSIEEVLSQTDIIALISSYFPLKRAGTLYKALCPFHNEKTPSFSVNPIRQSFKCFGCGEGGDAISFIRKYENLPFNEALRKLATLANVPLQEEQENPEERKQRRLRSRLITLHQKTAEHLHHLLLTDPAAQHARQYLQQRQYNLDLAKNWIIGWMPENPRPYLQWVKENQYTGRELIASGLAALKNPDNPREGLYLRFRDRLMFPIHNDYGDIIAFSGRQLREDPRSGKYINSPETTLFRKSHTLFALHRARRAVTRQGTVLICEGQLDAIACHQAGIEHAIAPLGTAFTTEHARLLKRYTTKATLCYDSDPAGEKATNLAFAELSKQDITVTVARLPQGEDPDSYLKKHGPEAFQTLLHQALDFFEDRLQRAKQNGLLDHATSRADLAGQLIDLLTNIENPIQREAQILKIAPHLELTPAALQNQLHNHKLPRYHQPEEDAPRQQHPIEPAKIQPEILALCKIALQSTPTQDWLCDQSETLIETLPGLEGEQLLRLILAKRPDPENPSSINTFLNTLPEPEALLLRNNLETPPLDDPVANAAEALGALTHKQQQQNYQQLVRQLLTDTTLTPEQKSELKTEIQHLKELIQV